MFSTPKANLADIEKSRIEFHLQQIAECIGFERFTLPVWRQPSLLELCKSNRDPQHMVEIMGAHLAHDVDGVQVRVVPQQSESRCGGGCGGGSCDGPSGLMGQYVADERTIILHAEIQTDPTMGLAALIHGVVSDLLHQCGFGSAHHPELVELAVVGTGLGMPRNNIPLVNRFTTCWDSTEWELFPRPFLDGRSLAYVNAIAAWARGDSTPDWVNELPSELKRPMRKSLKFLLKTNDSFFQPQMKRFLLSQSQNDWWRLAECASVTKQVIAIRHLDSGGELREQQQSLLLEKLRSANLAVVVNAIAAIERLAIQRNVESGDSFRLELCRLADHRNDQVRAKAMCALTKMGLLDEVAVELAERMLEDNLRHLLFAGAYALSTLDSVPAHILPSFDRCFVRVLRSCDYELVDLFVTAYQRWLEDPASHLKLLFRDSPEHLPIALDALQQSGQSLVQVRRRA